MNLIYNRGHLTGFFTSEVSFNYRSLAFGICKASKASIHKLAKVQGCFEGSRQYIIYGCSHLNMMRD